MDNWREVNINGKDMVLVTVSDGVDIREMLFQRKEVTRAERRIEKMKTFGKGYTELYSVEV